MEVEHLCQHDAVPAIPYLLQARFAAVKLATPSRMTRKSCGSSPIITTSLSTGFPVAAGDAEQAVCRVYVRTASDYFDAMGERRFLSKALDWGP